MVSPVFEFGRRKAQQEAAEARMQQARLVYEQSVLQALREVDDSLVAMRTWKDEQDARRRAANAAKGAVRLSTARYDGGVTSYLEVLDSERTRFNAELALVDTAGRTLSLITLYKALGGGWQQDATNKANASGPASK
jgi:multidrug efflux system outer membrane protein